MKESKYSATLNRSQGRSAYAMIFRHPKRLDKRGRYGLRVRRGLGTSDLKVAQAIVDQMNELLASPKLWSAGARSEASKLYNPIVVDAFYDSLETEPPDYWKIRDKFIELPSPDDDYARVLLLGTVGAGKTTVLRQLIGTDPKSERFPSTSASKTTVADLEVVVAEDTEVYEAIVTFYERSYVRQHIEECVAAAAMACFETKRDAEIERELLEHKEQRFRLSYVLGTSKAAQVSDDLAELDSDLPSEFLVSESNTHETSLSEEQTQLLETLTSYLDQIREFSEQVKAETIEQLGFDVSTATPEDVDTLKELFEEEAYENKRFQSVVGYILSDIEDRFDRIEHGVLKWSSNWPSHWTFKTNERKLFIDAVNRFSSNYAPHFGTLLTPMVEGVRVRGPFMPEWLDEYPPKLVLMDGQGLGHTANTTTSVSTRVTTRYKDCDVILLVDDASTPMQAAPTAVLKSLVSTGHHSKLMIAFTHFDDVVGDNLPTIELKQDHVLNSLRAARNSVGDALGPSASRALQDVEEERVFFLANAHKAVPRNNRYITYLQLNKMLAAFDKSIEPYRPSEAVPLYDLSNLILVVDRATREFHKKWQALLKLETDPNIRPEHWTRVKALSRRLGLLHEDEYDTLRPVADLLTLLRERLYTYLRDPSAWESEKVSEEMKEASIAQITRKLGESLHFSISARLFLDRKSEWERTYHYRGQGSTKVRARAIDQVYHDAAPIPHAIPSPASTQFINEIRELVITAISEGGGKLE